MFFLFIYSTHCLSAQFVKIAGARDLDNSTGGQINGHAWGDVDDDGDLDVIFFSAGSGNTAQSKLFLNSGAPTFTFTDATATQIAGFNDFNDYARQMLIVDFNNDGYNDIFRGFGSSREIEIFYNDGPPNYMFGLPTTQQPDVTIGAPRDGQEWNTEGMVAVDWNQDGWLDLIVGNDAGGNDVWENDQAGSFTYISPGTGLGETGFPASHGGDGDYMTAVDIDNDGYVDLCGRKTNVSNYWYFNSTTSQFETQANPNIVSQESDRRGTMFCDFDNDNIFNSQDLDADNDGILNVNENTCNNNLSLASVATASASSVGASGVPSRIKDNNTNGDWTGSSVAHTGDLSPNEWIDLDLGGIENIFNIVIWNRTDGCCDERLSNAYLMVSSTPFPSNTDLSASLTNAEFSIQFGNTDGISSLNTMIQQSGRYIRVQKSGTNLGGNSLQIAEIQAFEGCDFDGDGVANYLDTDSDQDGCPDAVEAGHIDVDNDGQVDGVGVDANGLVTGAVTSYTGSTPLVINQLDNSACCDVTISGLADNDGDNYADDICDLDDDNDGFLDLDEQNCGVLPPGGTGTPTVVLGGTPITTIYTNFGDFWESSVGAINPNHPSTTHKLLAFTAGGVTYTTDVPDDDLYDTDSNGLYDAIDTDDDGTGDVIATETSWQAFSNINEISSSGKVSLEGAMNDGDPTNALGLTVVNDPATDPLNPLLTNGVKGLDLGTGVANINETWYYSVEIITPAAVGDGIPDLIATQVAQPSGNTFQVVTFYDASWNPVGDAVRIETTGGGALSNHIATYNLDLYNANGSIFGANSTRPIRMASFELSEFGITPGDVVLIANMSIQFSSGADAAFVAYNEASFRGLCVDVDTDGDGIPDHLDNDSDNDGCVDAIEGAGIFNQANVNGSGRLVGAVGFDGVPTVASGGQGTDSDVTDNTENSQCDDCKIIRTNRHVFKRTN